MKPTRCAGFLLPVPAGAALDADQGDETDAGANGAGDGASDATTASSADDASGDGTDPDTADDEEEDIRDPERKRLSNESKRYRLRVRELEAKVAELETELAARPADSTTGVNALRVEKEFYRLAARQVTDLAAAFKLADLKGVTIDSDGTVTGIDQVVKTVVQHYPFLIGEPGTEPDKRTTAVPDGPKEGGSPSNRRRGQAEPNTSALQKKFPALGRHR